MNNIRAGLVAAAASIVLLAAGGTSMAKAATPPTAPSNLHAVSVTDTDIVLAWTPSRGDGVDYAVFFDQNPTPFLTGGTPSLDVQLNRAIGMIPGSTHTFQVRASNQAGEQSFSNKLTVAFAPGDNTPPTAPRNLRVVSNTSAGIELAWDPSLDESSFDYHVTGHPCSPLVVPGDVTHVLIPSIGADPVCGLLPGSRNTFAVWARDEFQNDSAFSNSVTVTFTG